MKKSLIAAVAIVLSGFSLAWAGHFTDILPPASAAGSVPVSNGYDYNLSGDSGAPAPNFAAPLQPWMRTLAQINALLPATTGQVVMCSNCVQSTMCVSSGSVNAGSWVVVAATGNFVGANWSGLPHCQ